MSINKLFTLMTIAGMELPLLSALSTTAFNISKLGPYRLNTMMNIEVTLTYIVNKRYDNMKENLIIYHLDNNTQYMTTTETHRVLANKTTTVKLKVDSKKMISKSGVTIIMNVYNSGTTNTSVFSKSITLYPTLIDKYSVFDTSKRVFKTGCLAYERVNNKDRQYYSTYDFTNFGEHFDASNYLYMPLENHKFKYISELDFEYDEAYILFNDASNIFPYYDVVDKSTGMKKISLILTNDNGTISMRCRSVMWYSEVTYEIGNLWRLGWSETNTFYFPKNKKRQIQGYTFNFYFKKVGGGLVDINLSLDYYSSRNLFGSCADSDYCINGGIVS